MFDYWGIWRPQLFFLRDSGSHDFLKFREFQKPDSSMPNRCSCPSLNQIQTTWKGSRRSPQRLLLPDLRGCSRFGQHRRPNWACLYRRNDQKLWADTMSTSQSEFFHELRSITKPPLHFTSISQFPPFAPLLLLLNLPHLLSESPLCVPCDRECFC